MNDRLLEIRDYFIDRSILFACNLANGTPVGPARLDRQADGPMQYPRRHAIGVCDIAETHPRANHFVLVVVPVNRAPDRAQHKEPGERQHQHKRYYDQPLSPPEFFHLYTQSITPYVTYREQQGLSGRETFGDRLDADTARRGCLEAGTARRLKLKSSA
jgi:hypothetical protein